MIIRANKVVAVAPAVVEPEVEENEIVLEDEEFDFELDEE